MTNQQLHKILLELANQGNCFTLGVRHILLNFKKNGTKQDIVVMILNNIKTEYQINLVLQ